MLKDITLGQYFPGDTLAHKLDPRTKLLVTVLYIVALFTAKSYLAYGLLVLTLVVAVRISRVSVKALFKGLKPVLFIIAFTEFFAAHRGAVGATYLYFPSATIEMVGYLTMTLIASFILHWVEQRMDGNIDYELAKTDPLTMAAGTYSHPDRGTPFDERSKEYRDRVRQELQHGRTRGDR